MRGRSSPRALQAPGLGDPHGKGVVGVVLVPTWGPGLPGLRGKVLPHPQPRWVSVMAFAEAEGMVVLTTSHLLLPAAVTGLKQRHAVLLDTGLRLLTHSLSSTKQPPGCFSAPGSACWKAITMGITEVFAPGSEIVLCSPQLGQGGVLLGETLSHRENLVFAAFTLSSHMKRPNKVEVMGEAE